MLGFLSVSTAAEVGFDDRLALFQSRAGFSECLDWPVSVLQRHREEFQSRAGFSECLDCLYSNSGNAYDLFQSRAGFSECLDRLRVPDCP